MTRQQYHLCYFLPSPKFHRTKILSMKCNATLILCGEDVTGQVVIYSRQEIVNASKYKLEHILGAGVPSQMFDAVKPP